MQKWKALGIAGLVGVVAATGVVATRRRRTTVAIDPAELRARLHERLAAAEAAASHGEQSQTSRITRNSNGEWTHND